MMIFITKYGGNVMKKTICILLITFILPIYSLMAEDEDILKGTKVKKFPFYVYKDSMNQLNHYIPSGWMGDYNDIKYNDKWKKNPKSGKTCIQIKYSARKSTGAGWSGIYWQNPANNWGTSLGGYNLTGCKKVLFYARGNKGGEVIEFKIGGISGQYSDTATASSGSLELTKNWKLYEIDIEGLDLNFINGGFCVIFSSTANPEGATFYIDEIYYSKKTKPIK